MKTCSKCGEEKPLTEYRKRSASKDGLQPYCKICHSATEKARKDSKRDELSAARREKYANDESFRKAQHARSTKWAAENRERTREIKRKSAQRPEAKAAMAARVRKRQAAKLQRTPSWANEQLIAAYYKEAKRLEELTGIEFHVDHIIPLQGELVSGLHVETNLQLLPAHENIGKSNSFDPQTFCA